MPAHTKPRDMSVIAVEKRCCRCGETKPHTEFHLWNKSPDGLNPRCKACRTKLEGSDTYLDYLAERARGNKLCSECERVKPLAEFHQHAKTKIGYRASCKECREPERKAQYAAETDEDKAARRAYYQANREAVIQRTMRAHKARWAEVLAYGRAWRKANPDKRRETEHRQRARRALAFVVPFTDEQLQAKMAYWGNRCWMCHGEATSIDHVKPIAKGGPHALANLRPACHSCNASKSAKWPYPLLS
jgi:5-methylcytosine-specific restriction endonuclease McrA